MSKKEKKQFLKYLDSFKVTFKSLYQADFLADSIFRHIDKIWKEKQSNEILPYLQEKFDDARVGKITGFAAFKENEIIGICWLDPSSERYGSILLHTILTEYEPLLAAKLIRSQLLLSRVVEIITFRDPKKYLETFLALGYKEKFRYRMGLKKEEFLGVDPMPKGLAVKSITEKDIETISEISYIAHKERNDLEGYIDYSTLDYCINHKTRLFQNEFGKFIPDASLLLTYFDKPIGAVVSIEIKYWGLECMSWVFDVILLPEYHGYGFGKILMQQMLEKTFSLNYPMIGLSVTVSNKKAKNLYEKLGFLIYEEYHEIIGPDSLKEK